MNADFIARAIASRASSDRASSVARRHAMRIFGGRVAGASAVTTNQQTFETVIGIACPADAIRLVFAFGQTGAGDAVPVEVMSHAASIASASDADIQAAGASAKIVTTGGTATRQFAPSAVSTRRKLYRSDWIALPSKARTDGGEGALYAIRSTLTAASGSGPVVMLGNGTDSFANWENHPSGRIFRSRSKQLIDSSNWSGFTRANSSAAVVSPVVGIEYLARGRVVSVAGFGDSITEGRGTYLGEGFGHPACVALSNNANGIAFEWSNLGWAGQGASQIFLQVQDALDAGLLPGVAVMPVFTPNGFLSSPSEAAINSMRLFFGQALDRLEQAGVDVIQWTGLSCSPSLFPVGTADGLRRALNRENVDASGRGVTVCDFAARLDGEVDGSGQSVPRPGVLVDGIHPSDAGNALMAEVLRYALQSRVELPQGLRAA